MDGARLPAWRPTPILDKQEDVVVGRDSNSPKNMMRWEKPNEMIPPMNEMSITAPFVCSDDFAILFEQRQRHHLIPSERKRFRQGKLSLGECMFIMALFHCSPYSWSASLRLTASETGLPAEVVATGACGEHKKCHGQQQVEKPH